MDFVDAFTDQMLRRTSNFLSYVLSNITSCSFWTSRFLYRNHLCCVDTCQMYLFPMSVAFTTTFRCQLDQTFFIVFSCPRYLLHVYVVTCQSYQDIDIKRPHIDVEKNVDLQEQTVVH